VNLVRRALVRRALVRRALGRGAQVRRALGRGGSAWALRGSAAWRVLAVGGLLVLLLTLLGALVLDDVLDGGGVAGLDRPTLGWVVEHRTPAWSTFFAAVTTLGDTAVVATTTIVVVVGLLLARRWVSAGQVALAQVGAGTLVAVGKAAVGRQRPPETTRLAVEGTLSFPSGHALGTIVLALTLVSLVWRCSARRWVRLPAASVAALLVLGVGVSRVYLGVHWVTDVLGGWLVGGTWATVCLVAAVLLRLRVRAPVS
jgi:membrane-associated phospholipid phosphatase